LIWSLQWGVNWDCFEAQRIPSIPHSIISDQFNRNPKISLSLSCSAVTNIKYKISQFSVMLCGIIWFDLIWVVLIWSDLPLSLVLIGLVEVS
jgi:hypothetical protein